MDLFPRSADPKTMEDRRVVLAQALRVAGMTLAAPFRGLFRAAEPYVRLPDEQGTIAEERERFAGELAALNAHLLLQPAIQTQPAVFALWANLHQRRRTAKVNDFGLKANTAILAGVNSVTLTDRANGKRWFDRGQLFARLAGDRELTALAYARAALAGLYWGEAPRSTIANAALTYKYAHTDEIQGLGHGTVTRAVASMGQQDIAVRAAERAIGMASDSPLPPRVDRWSSAFANAVVGRALANFPKLLPAVEEHSQKAVHTFPAEAVLDRAHAHLNIAEVRVRAGVYDGAATTIMSVLDSLPQLEFQPVLMARVDALARQAEQQHPGAAPMRPVCERLAAFSA